MIAVTPGEPAGIGPDLAVISVQKKLAKNLLFFADPNLIRSRAKLLNIELKVVESDSEVKNGEINIYPIESNHSFIPGELKVSSAEYVLNSIDLAIDFNLKNKSEALITGPIHKGIINQAGITFTGHTEYLEKKTSSKKTVMMLATDNLRVALATTHLPLSKVPKNINQESLRQTIRVIHNSLVQLGINNPKILVCGLNPHAGEDGYLGHEEIEIINPLIQDMNKEGFNLLGSVSADTAFTPESLKGVDVVLSMFHDQGLPIIKTLGFKRAINITLGLPFIRTSVDHGTAINLAGTNQVNSGSFEYVIDYTKGMIKSYGSS
jgi:4-hydroxythreonine-4-phosphate dehydrogenase